MPAPAAALAPLPPVVVRSSSESAQLPDDAVALPLRMSILSAVASPSPSDGMTVHAACGQSSVDAASTNLPVQPHVEVQLTLRLTLETFSNLGCPGDPYAAFDTGMGGGLAYASPLRKNLWLVAAAGMYGMPSRGEGVGATGVDLMWKSPSGRTTSVWVGTVSTTKRGTRIMARVGGTF